MGTTFEREPADILLGMKVSSNSDNTVRWLPIKRPPDEDISMDVASTTEVTTCCYNGNDGVKPKQYLESTWESDQPPVQEEVEITATQMVTNEFATPQASRQTARIKEQQAQLPKSLKESLKRLKNLLKLPKARRWVYCEFFCPDVDRELLVAEHEFRECLRESFPNLKTHLLRRAEWRQVRRLIGRPRRCSQAFYDGERAAMEAKRCHIRNIHNGETLVLNIDDAYIPLKVPKQLVVGAKVHARVHHPKDGVYGGTVDAVMDGRYRIIFDKDVVMPLIVPDFEVMSERSEEMVPISFFLEKNKAAQPLAYRNNHLMTASKYLSSSEAPASSTVATLHDPVLTSVNCPAATQIPVSTVASAPTLTTAVATAPVASTGRDGRCGNFPLRLVVMLVKLSKLIEIKKMFISQVQDMNNEAERMHLYAESYIRKFQERYAKAVLELEQVNKQLEAYLRGISEYSGTLLPQLSELTVTSRPEALHKFCQTHASLVVKNSSRTLHVRNQSVLDLITSLTALLLQIRALGQQRCNAYELHSLQQTIRELKETLPYDSRGIFEDHVEVHVKHIGFTMQGGDATASLDSF